MRTLPVLTHHLIFQRVRNEYLAISAWRYYVAAHGWSTVGEPALHKVPEGYAVEGRVVRTEEPLALADDIQHLVLP